MSHATAKHELVNMYYMIALMGYTERSPYSVTEEGKAVVMN